MTNSRRMHDLMLRKKAEEGKETVPIRDTPPGRFMCAEEGTIFASGKQTE